MRRGLPWGRWQWVAKAEVAFEELRAACRRINDKFPAGVVTLRGEFAREHKEEMVRLARHQEEAEKKEHPLNRIINIEDDGQRVVIKRPTSICRAALARRSSVLSTARSRTTSRKTGISCV
jgi:hypothetical protein